jgi:hypothetical protein
LADVRLGVFNRVFVAGSLGEAYRHRLKEELKLRMPDDLLPCVFFLAVGDATNLHYGGTGFFVSTRSEAVSDRSYVYLVAAKHSIEKAKEEPGTLYLRVNSKDGGSRLLEAPVDWIYSERDGSDIAVAYFPLPWSADLEIKYIPVDLAVTQQTIASHEIGIGDELCVVGLFTEHTGAARNRPIVRGGILASMPHEPLEDPDTGHPYSAYLAEVRSAGGLSGSPVFVAFPLGRLRGSTERVHSDEHEAIQVDLAPRAPAYALLLGALRGHWNLANRTDSVAFGSEDLKAVNMGIAIVTPVQDALDIINGEELVKQRRTMDREETKRHAPRPGT